MFSPGIEPGTFCVLDRCDNHYTTKTCWENLAYFHCMYINFWLLSNMSENDCHYNLKMAKLYWFEFLNLNKAVDERVHY